MNAVAVRLVAELRNRWRAWAGLALIVGLLAGVVFTAAAGARRTDSAYPRLLEDTDAADLLISVAESGLTGSFYEEIEQLPQVGSAATVAGMALLPAPGGPLDETGSLDALAGVEGGYGVDLDRPKLLAGRLPDPSRPNEALANREMARVFALEVGAEVPALAPSAQYSDPSAIEAVTFTVVGIGLFPHEVVPGSLLDAQPRLLLSPSYFDAHRTDELNYDGIAVRLHPGADREAFRRGVDELAEVHRPDVGEIFVSDNTAFHAKTERAIRPQSVALALFAVLGGAAT